MRETYGVARIGTEAKTSATAAAARRATASPSQSAKTLGPAPEMEKPRAPALSAARFAR